MLNIAYGALTLSNYRIYFKKKDTKLVEYNYNELTTRGYHKNAFMRTFAVFENKLSDEKYGFDKCYDCSLLGGLLDKLMITANVNEKDKEYFVHQMLRKMFGKTLKVFSHGYRYDNSDECIVTAYKKELVTRKMMRDNKIQINKVDGGFVGKSTKNTFTI